MTLFWPVGGWHRGEADRVKDNLRFIKACQCDYFRVLGQVGWKGQEIDPFWPDYQDALAAVIDAAWDVGLRTQLTAIGGWSSLKPPATGHGPLACAQRMLEVLQGREEKIMMLEAVNEDNASTEEAIAIAKLFAPLGCLFGVGLGNKGITTIKDATKAARANVSYYHTSRVRGPANDPGGPYARMVRQCWDFKEFDTPSVDNEPPGIASSVNVMEDPRQMAVKRAADITCGGAAFCTHPGSGVFGLEMDGTWGHRYANLYDVPGLKDMALMVKNAEQHMPEGVANWTKFNTNKPVEVAAGKVNKLYGARSGTSFQEIVIGCEGTVTLRAGESCHMTVVDPASGAVVVERDFPQDDTHDVSGSWGYLVVGTQGSR